MSIRSSTSSVIATICLLGVAFGGCSQREDWSKRDPAKVESSDDIIVLFAPVDPGAAAAVNPEARLEFARDMASRLDLLADGVQAWVGETLPDSSAPAWDAGAVGATSGAHVVVLTRVLGVEVEPETTQDARVSARVRMSARNVAGEEIWFKITEAQVRNKASPKNMHAGAHPVSKSAWEACKKGLTALKYWLELQPGGIVRDRWADDGGDEELPLIDVAFDSYPKGADIMVDGLFRGNTPATVPLPVRELTVRIERQGYQVWERKLTPSTDMKIQPALEPLPGSDPAPAPAPKPEPAPEMEEAEAAE